MKIRYISDIHLEHIPPQSPVTASSDFVDFASSPSETPQISQDLDKLIQGILPVGDDEVCILAGDIGILNSGNSNYDVFMKFISKSFKKTFVIAGNHEYYHKTATIVETNAAMTQYFQQYDNIRFLNNEFEMYENYCFIGTTLWTFIKNPRLTINDIHYIPQFDVVQYNELHRQNIAFLEETLQQQQDDKVCVVITHHIPSDQLVNAKFKNPVLLPYNQWFACDLDELIQKYKDKIVCWFYGHTHMASEMMLEGIPFLCNPVGYPHENSTIDLHKTITV